MNEMQKSNTKNLVYTTIGCSIDYVKCVEYFIKSIFTYSSFTKFDILIICDQDLIKIVHETIRLTLSNMNHLLVDQEILFAIVPNAKTPMRASMQKLIIFQIESIQNYSNVLYIDLDVLCLIDLNTIFESYEKHICDKNQASYKLQAAFERSHYEDHQEIFWSMNDYTNNDIDFFRERKILPFNAGCFMFRVNKTMDEHIKNVCEMIEQSRKDRKLFFYEQAFMNVYFNKRNLVEYDIINSSNYKMFPDLDMKYTNKILHFCGSPGHGKKKYEMIKEYAERHNVFGENISHSRFRKYIL